MKSIKNILKEIKDLELHRKNLDSSVIDFEVLKDTYYTTPKSVRFCNAIIVEAYKEIEIASKKIGELKTLLAFDNARQSGLKVEDYMFMYTLKNIDYFKNIVTRKYEGVSSK